MSRPMQDVADVASVHDIGNCILYHLNIHIHSGDCNLQRRCCVCRRRSERQWDLSLKVAGFLMEDSRLNVA